MICECGDDESKHGTEEPRVCGVASCACWGFKAKAAPRPDYHAILAAFEKSEERVKWILDNMPELVDLPNHEFLFVYWQIVNNLNITTEQIQALDDYQTIERSRRLLAAENDKYKSKNETLVEKKSLMQFVTQEYVTQRN